MRPSVVLPQPDSPTRPRHSPGRTVKDTSSSAWTVWRVLAKAHEKRNLAEYEGYLEPDGRLLADVLAATRALIAALPTDEKD